MWKLALVVSMLWSASHALAETTAISGLDASKVIRDGQILGTEVNEWGWHILVNHDDVLYACSTVGYGTHVLMLNGRGGLGGLGGMGGDPMQIMPTQDVNVLCLPLPYLK
jgi:hypothetical protein